MKKFIVLIGNYGSGKTEIALNLALQAAREGKRTALVDLDIVNPYFRSGEYKELMAKNNVRLIVPPFSTTNVDVPALSAEVQRVFAEDYEKVIFDVGGDTVGATALGRYHSYFAAVQDQLETLAVINTCRPLCQHPDDIAVLLTQMSHCARLPLTGIINNTNLARESSGEILFDGRNVLKEVEKQVNVAVLYDCGTEKTLNEYAEFVKNIQQLPEQIQISTYTRPEWLDDSVE